MYVGKITAKQIEGLQSYIHSVIGQNIYSNSNGDTIIDLLYTDEIKNEHGKPIKTIVTDALNAVRAARDNNHLLLSDYIYNIEPIMYHPNQLRISHGKDIANKELGQILTINNVENAENDSYNQPIHTYIKSITQNESDSFTVNTGEQSVNNVEGVTFTINKVKEAENAINDQYGKNIANNYADVNHLHKIEDIKNLNEYINNNIVNLINKLLSEGKIQVVANTIEYSQYPQYHFNDNETILISLSKNTKYARPQPEVLKLVNEKIHWSSFTYSFNINMYKTNKNYINDEGWLITNKDIEFGPPRQLGSGYISYSGIVTNDNIKRINNIIIN